MKALRTIALSTVAAVSLVGTAAADQSGSSSDWFSNWRWSTSESILNLNTAQLIEKKKDDFFHTDVHNDYRGANFGQQQAISIGNQTIQECEVSGSGYCEADQSNEDSDQGANNRSAAGQGNNSSLNLNQTGSGTRSFGQTLD